ncbi:LOW QUALITY PROTEIN: uncharacterized family 31 glucosidase ORF2-like [Saccostrea echinata]|uniref:LOW QUALITY PROTEIN: uncharacterized family 31 glucosidase ORF2-like n=1 Tax=Saccostrea echinata TaxID=191078 RepID=UPI002A7FEA00|nr:LOW QUALITY PROTEIN: uncharacterized family 31 glucosidase ORF2-like [Saccostrea echinata]
MIYTQDHKLYYRFDAETMVIEAWGTDSLRVRSWLVARMPPDDWALTEPVCNSDAVVELQKNGEVVVQGVIQNGKISARLDMNGKLVFENQEGKVLLEEYYRNRKEYNFLPGKVPSGFASALEIEAREFMPVAGDNYMLTMRFEANPTEKIYGMGQYQQPYLNLKGCELELAQRNSQASVPFALSSLGYGFLWNNPAVGRVCFARNLSVWTAQATDKLDYWITAGEKPADILASYARVTGNVPMMPDWAMGFWQCKLRYQTQEELLEVAREYKRRNVPLSVIVIDFFHWTCQGEWKFDPVYWPDPQAMVDELKQMGIELMISVWPSVDQRSENYAEMEEKGYLIRTERGHRISMMFYGNTIHYDATNPEARKYLWNRIKENYYVYGIRTFWLDEAEPEYTYYHYDHYRYHKGSSAAIGNIYPAMYARTFYEGMLEEGQKNIINLLRCAWAGSQKYGALVWSGDIDSSFPSLRNQFAAGLNMGLAGIPWWTTDIGGFHGGDASDPEFRECFIRWFQYAAFCPVMRLHGDREPHAEPLDTRPGATGGGVCNSGAENEIWSYGQEIYQICRKYILIRERLQPYLQQLMLAAHQCGMPVIRPLFFDFPQDTACWEIEDQYMFGPEILVAPILYYKSRCRKVYLPSGCQWRNPWNNRMMEGGQTVEAEAPVAQIPLFIRGDSRVAIL